MDDILFERTLDRIQEASFDPQHWPGALDLLVEAAGARGAIFMPVRGRIPNALVSDGIAELADAYFREGWARNDFRDRSIPKLLATGISTDQDLITPDAMKREPLYADLMTRFGMQWYAGLGIVTDDDAWCVSFQRTPAQGFFSERDQADLMRFLRPLRQATRVGRHLQDAHLRGVADGTAVVGAACILLDRHGRAVHLNERAEQLLGEDILVRGGEIRLGNRVLSAALRRHIRSVIWAGGADPSDRGGILVERRTGSRLLFEAFRPRGLVRGWFSRFEAMLVITELDTRDASPAARLQRLFRLTPSEARLAQALSRTRRLQDAAESLGISHETARTHIRSVFSKTATETQGQLISLLDRVARAP